MKKWLIVIIIIFSYLPSLAGGAPDGKTAPVRPAPLKQAVSIPSQPWQAEWEKTLSAAKKEGMVSVVTNWAGIKPVVAPAFQSKYGIKVEVLTMPGPMFATKLATERAAGIFSYDVYIGGASPLILSFKPQGTLDPLAPALILPEVVDPKVWYGGQPGWADRDKTVFYHVANGGTGSLLVNTTLASPQEFKSFYDLLNPKWQGKIVMSDPTMPGMATFVHIGWYILNLDYFRELVKQKPVIVRDWTVAVESVVRGKYPLGFLLHEEVALKYKDDGAPVEFVSFKEANVISRAAKALSLFNRAPHPNAARVFINWFLSREGQIAAQKAIGDHSARIDIPPEGVITRKMRIAGVDYKDVGMDSEEATIKRGERYPILKQIFAPLMK